MKSGNLFLTAILVAVLTFTVNVGFAQNLSIEWGKSFDSSTEVQKILGFTGNQMVAYSSKGKNNYIETYEDKGLSLVNSAIYETPEIGSTQTGLLNITLGQGKVIAIVYSYDKKTKSFSLHMQQLSTEGKQIGRLEELYASNASDERIKDRIVDVEYSQDNTKLLVFFDRTDKDRLKFFSDVVVVDLNKPDESAYVGKYEFTMREAKSEKVDFKMYHSLENDGKFFFMREKIEFTKKVISDFALDVDGYNLNGDKIGETKLQDEGKVLMSPCIISNNDNTGFNIVGYYMSNPKKRAAVDGYAGLFVADLGSDMDVKSFKSTQFKDNFFLDLYSQRRIDRLKEKGKEILVPAPFTMDYVILHTDGTMTILSEYYQVIVTDNGKGQRTTQTVYGSIIMLKVNADAEILADDVIKKMQTSSTTSIGLGVGTMPGISMFVSYETKDKRKKYWSYAISMKDDNIYLVFNDNVKNSNDDEDELSSALTNPSKSIPFLVTIDPDGKFTKTAMAESGDTETYCVPQITYHIDDDNFIIWGVRRKENKFGRATIK